MMHKDSKLTREFLLGSSSSKTSTQTATNNSKTTKKDDEKRKPRVVHSMLDLNPRATNSTIEEEHQRQDNGIINGNATYSFFEREENPLLEHVVVIPEETSKTTQQALPQWGREDSCSSLCLSEAVAPPPKIGAPRTGRRHSMMAVPEHATGDDVVALSDSQADLIFARYQPTRRRRGRNMTNRFQDLSVDRRELLLDNEESFRSILSDMRSSTKRGGDTPSAVSEKDDDDSTISEVSEADVDDNDFDIEVMSSMMDHSQFEQARVACFGS